MVSTKTLQKIALGGFILVGSAGIFVKSRIRVNFCRQQFYIKPLVILNNYAPGGDILGKPIGINKVDLSDQGNNWTDGLQAKVAIPLSGTRLNGTLHAWSARPVIQSEWVVQKADLEINNKQWTFYIHPSARDQFQPTQDTQATGACSTSPDVTFSDAEPTLKEPTIKQEPTAKQQTNTQSEPNAKH